MRYKHFQVTNTYTVLPDQSVPGTSTHGWWWDLLSTSTLLLPEQWDQWSHDQVTRSGDHHGNFVREKEVISCSEAVGVLPWKQSTPLPYTEQIPVLSWGQLRTGTKESRGKRIEVREREINIKWKEEKRWSTKWEELWAKTVYNDGETRMRIGVSSDYTM